MSYTLHRPYISKENLEDLYHFEENNARDDSLCSAVSDALFGNSKHRFPIASKIEDLKNQLAKGLSYVFADVQKRFQYLDEVTQSKVLKLSKNYETCHHRLFDIWAIVLLYNVNVVLFFKNDQDEGFHQEKITIDCALCAIRLVCIDEHFQALFSLSAADSSVKEREIQHIEDGELIRTGKVSKYFNRPYSSTGELIEDRFFYKVTFDKKTDLDDRDFWLMTEYELMRCLALKEIPESEKLCLFQDHQQEEAQQQTLDCEIGSKTCDDDLSVDHDHDNCNFSLQNNIDFEKVRLLYATIKDRETPPSPVQQRKVEKEIKKKREKKAKKVTKKQTGKRKQTTPKNQKAACQVIARVKARVEAKEEEGKRPQEEGAGCQNFFCIFCSAKLPVIAKFCFACGEKVYACDA